MIVRYLECTFMFPCSGEKYVFIFLFEIFVLVCGISAPVGPCHPNKHASY